MNRSLILAFKDLRLLMRDKSTLFWVIVFPLLIAVLFGSIFGGSNGPNKIEIALIDQDKTPESAQLVKALKASTALNILPPPAASQGDHLQSARESVRKGDLAAYLLIPRGFGDEVRTFQYSKGPGIKIGIDPTRQAEAGMLQGVASQAAYTLMSDSMSNFSGNRSVLKENLARIRKSTMSPKQKDATVRLLTDLNKMQAAGTLAGGTSGGSFKFQGPRIESDSVAASDAHQPASSFEITFPQALIWGLLGVISSFAISMVKERQQGTLVRLQTSMSMGEILAGKALACFFACAGVMAGLLMIGHFAFKVRLESPLLLALAISCGSLCVVGIMMLLSVLGRTEQAVSGSSWGVMIIMAMFGGGMIPIFMMPGWMQSASNLSPLKWTVLSVEGAIWRGFSFSEMIEPCIVLLAIGAVCFGIGVKVLRTRI